MKPEYRFVSKDKNDYGCQVLQIRKSVDRSTHRDIFPDIVETWIDANRWEAEEFLKNASNNSWQQDCDRFETS